jgi:nucleotide-binding universal stress UspA family protein
MTGEGALMNIRNVLVAIDFGESSTQTLRAGIDWANRSGAVLHAVHVVDSTDLSALGSRHQRSTPEQITADAEREARHNLADALAAAGAPADARAVVLVSPRAADAILRYAASAQIDMIAVGRGGRTEVADIFLGSNAQQIVSRAPCPVLTLRAANHD